MRKIRVLLIVFFLILLIFSAGNFASVLIDYHNSRESYASLEQYISFGDLDDGTPDTNGVEEIASPADVMDSEAGTQLPQNPASHEGIGELYGQPDEYPQNTSALPSVVSTAAPAAATITPAATTAASASAAEEYAAATEASISATATNWPEVEIASPADVMDSEAGTQLPQNPAPHEGIGELYEQPDAYPQNAAALPSVVSTAAPAAATITPAATTAASASAAEEYAAATEASISATATNWPEVDFDRLSSINPEVVGWIYLEGTHINYPIVQAEDNKQYLKRMFDGQRNPAGCIFLDYRCANDFSDLHNILYGHHMKDDSMFADLVLYNEQSFYDEYPTALLITPTHRYRIELFSSYVANDKDDAWQLSFGQQEFELWLKNRIDRSSFQGNVLPDGNENILTLSTCTYDYNGAKYILHGFVAEAIEY